MLKDHPPAVTGPFILIVTLERGFWGFEWQALVEPAGFSRMQEVAPGRVGLQGAISGFVVAEDVSASARAKRALDTVCSQAARLKAEGFAAFARRMGAISFPVPRPAWLRLPRLAVLNITPRLPSWLGAAWRVVALNTIIRAAVVFGGLALHAMTLPGRVRQSAHEKALPTRWKFRRLALAAGTVVLGLGAAYLGVASDHEPAASVDTPGAPHAVAPLLPPTPEAQPVIAASNSGPSELSATPVAAKAAVEPPAPVVLPIGEMPWVPVKRPMAMYHLEAPEIEGSDFVLEVALRGKSARRERMFWQSRREGAGARPLILLTTERYKGEQPLVRPFFPDMAARAAEMQASIERMAPQGIVTSKFGDLEIADSTLRIADKLHACLMFRRVDSLGFVLSGWYCGLPGRPADRVALHCFVDRLDLLGAGQDKVLKRYFGEAERKRKLCPSARSAGKKLTWLDHEAPLPALKLDQRAARR